MIDVTIKGELLTNAKKLKKEIKKLKKIIEQLEKIVDGEEYDFDKWEGTDPS